MPRGTHGVLPDFLEHDKTALPRSVAQCRKSLQSLRSSHCVAGPCGDIADARFGVNGVRVAIRLDRDLPGAHLIWDVFNAGTTPMTLAKLIVHGRHGAVDTWPSGLPKVLLPNDRLFVPTDVDWSLLAARSIAVVDADGREHVAPHRDLGSIQDRLRDSIDRRIQTASARDWLSGIANFTFGAAIVGLGFVMMMWVIAAWMGLGTLVVGPWSLVVVWDSPTLVIWALATNECWLTAVRRARARGRSSLEPGLVDVERPRNRGAERDLDRDHDATLLERIDDPAQAPQR